MNTEFQQRILDQIIKTVELSFKVETPTRQMISSLNNDTVIFRAESPEYPTGYSFRITIYSKRFDIQFAHDNYATKLLREMERNRTGHAQFSKLAPVISDKSSILDLKINNQKMKTTDHTVWPSDWRKLDILFQRYSEEFEPTNMNSIEPAIIDAVNKFCTLVIALMPTEEATNYTSLEIRGLPEGAKTRVEVNKYERNPINRAACITAHGTSCKICDFNFEEKYGTLGRDFIHIHHIVPISKMTENYVVDPILDLVPVCPNCHSMLHREDPPLAVEQLKAILAGTVGMEKTIS